MPPLLEVQGLRKRYSTRPSLPRNRGRPVHAVNGVSFAVDRGEAYGLVGESGSGKTTIGRCVAQLLRPTAGRIVYEGEDLALLKPSDLKRLRRRFQMVFQDSLGSLNPRLRIRSILNDVLAHRSDLSRAQRASRIERLLETVGLEPDSAVRFPHEFSGGQRQRLGIARALATDPELIVADEPVSALDVSVRAQIVNLLQDLRRRCRLALLLIAHDLSVVERVADRVGVLYAGKIVETADTNRVFRRPLHPYTVALLSAVPMVDRDSGRRRIVLPGEPPDPADLPGGCRFHPRCPIAEARCAEFEPPLEEVNPGRWVACHVPGGLAPGHTAG